MKRKKKKQKKSRNMIAYMQILYPRDCNMKDKRKKRKSNPKKKDWENK